MMPHCRIMENLQTRNSIQKYISQTRMQSDNGKFIICQWQILIVDYRHDGILSNIMNHSCFVYKGTQSSFMFQHFRSSLISEHSLKEFWFMFQHPIQQHLSYFSHVHRMSKGCYLSRNIQTTHKPDHLLITEIFHQPPMCR